MRRLHTSGGAPPIAPIPRPTYQSPRIVCWAKAHAAAPTTQTLSGNLVMWILHYEELLNGAVYDALIAKNSSGSANTVALCMHSLHATTQNPDKLLWSSATSSTVSANTNHIMTFAAGTWTSDGAAYKNSSNNLVLPQGGAVHLGICGSGNISYFIITTSAMRNLNIDADMSNGGHYGFQEAMTHPTFPATATPVARQNQMPILGLRMAA